MFHPILCHPSGLNWAWGGRPGIYAAIGAASCVSAITQVVSLFSVDAAAQLFPQTLSPSVILFELTGQTVLLVPVTIAVVVYIHPTYMYIISQSSFLILK